MRFSFRKILDSLPCSRSRIGALFLTTGIEKEETKKERMKAIKGFMMRLPKQYRSSIKEKGVETDSKQI